MKLQKILGEKDAKNKEKLKEQKAKLEELMNANFQAFVAKFVASYGQQGVQVPSKTIRCLPFSYSACMKSLAQLHFSHFDFFILVSL